ncbi:GIY-YIG nuclease family protein [Chromobacterium amazonense]|uniref:GIY-YIG nuclease family protein n=1 Tax=Chromobacterium amazonense TaxID=1382803 RepID=UPI0031F68158
MPIIKNYGFLWERKYIFRGAGSNAGHLKGAASGLAIADFRDQIGVYVLYDQFQNIVYVGQAGNGNASLFTRLKNHMDGSMWNRWQYFTWVGFKAVNQDGSLSAQQSVDSGVSGFKYSDALNEIEGILIEVLEPKLNKQSGRLKGAVEYFQYVDAKVSDVTAAALLAEIKELKLQLSNI